MGVIYSSEKTEILGSVAGFLSFLSHFIQTVGQFEG